MPDVDSTFELSYNGLPFLRPPPRVLDFVERYFRDNFPRFVQWPDPSVFAGGMQAYHLPLPPAPPGPRLNRFYYPYGLIRWASFWGIMTGDSVASLRTAAFGGGGPTYLTFKATSNGVTIETPLMMLPPFKLAIAGTNSAEQLYLVTLVDERYERRWLRFVSTSQPSLSVPTEGATETVDAAYSGLTLAGPAGSAATGNENHSTLSEYALYDHAASCLGMVWVRDYQPTAGKYLYRTRWETANALAVTDGVGDEAAADLPRAGSNADSFSAADTTTSRRALMPATVRVGFPAVIGTATIAGDTPDGKPSWWWKTVNPPGGLPVGNTLAAVTTLEPATYAADPVPAGTPTNDAALTTLANQIGEDFYHALMGQCDLVFPDLVETDPRWACDFIFDFAAAAGEQTTTRIMRDPFNGRYAVDLLIGKDLVPRGPQSPAAVGFFTRRTECVIGDGPINYPGGESAFGIRLGVGQSLYGTVVISGQMFTLFRQSVIISTSAIVQVEKLNNINLSSEWYARRGVTAGINALTLGNVSYAASFAVALGITEISYDSPHPSMSGHYVIVNTGASETLVIVRVRAGFGTIVQECSAVWNYTIF